MNRNTIVNAAAAVAIAAAALVSVVKPAAAMDLHLPQVGTEIRSWFSDSELQAAAEAQGAELEDMELMTCVGPEVGKHLVCVWMNSSDTEILFTWDGFQVNTTEMSAEAMSNNFDIFEDLSGFYYTSDGVRHTFCMVGGICNEK